MSNSFITQKFSHLWRSWKSSWAQKKWIQSGWHTILKINSDLTWIQIDYFNNQIIVDLVEQPHKGIISILDEACLTVGNVTDTVCLGSMNSKLAQHPHYTSRKVRPQPSTTCLPLAPSRLHLHLYTEITCDSEKAACVKRIGLTPESGNLDDF